MSDETNPDPERPKPKVGDNVFLPRVSPLGALSYGVTALPGTITRLDDDGWAIVDRGRWGLFGLHVDDLTPADGSRVPGWPADHMLEAAAGLLANATADHQRADWEQARRRWVDAYHDRLHTPPDVNTRGEEHIPAPPQPPADWLKKFSASSKGSGGAGWQTGWQAGYVAAHEGLQRLRQECRASQAHSSNGSWTDMNPLWPSEILAILDGGSAG
jgi:hypothetical protein